MRYAETGYNLEIDLSRGSIERVETDPRLTELHLGGQGTAAKIIWDRVPPETEPFSPDNLIIFSSGLLNCTPVPGANRCIVNTISPQTNLFVNSMLGGYFGTEMKYAGYDRIIIRGKSPNLVYLWINNDKVEIRDASHLQGKGAMETQGILQAELDASAQVAAIGLAGENRVYGASIEHASSAAARMAGVVMGDKRLKAIAIRGTKDINVAHPTELWGLCEPKYKSIADDPENGDPMRLDPSNDAWHMENFAWGNARERRRGYFTKDVYKNDVTTTDKARLRWVGCYNCPKMCKQMLELEDGRKFFTKCFNRLIYMMAAYVEDFSFSYEMLARTTEYGMDGFATPQLLAFAVELYEAGVLTNEDLPDFPADNAERFFYLLDITVRREGFVGDALADGVYWAARKIGRGAEKYDHNTTKKVEQVPLKLGKVNFPYYLMYATGEKMSITQIEGSYPQAPEPDLEKRKKLVEGWEAAPERFKKWFLEWEPRVDPSIEESVNITDWNEMMHYVDDSIGTCAWLSSFRGQFGCRPAYHMYNLPEFISYASGLELDTDKLWKIATRNRTLVRAINNRRGLRRIDEAPPADHWKIREPEKEQAYLDGYYAFKGWTNEGIPTKETLDKLGLDYVSEDFIQRGILTSDGGEIREG
ncbi:aldehyde ferredoxin oxidoreductase N-terminal domain-containing protein [Desulfosporosinus nitroreducens]|uniref:Aldehyde dehydrogenase n=1 Tax=Desulfosporosinus nitroreducens TaxID=2018668 RepID=A0ABT8QNU2_9FIRM|nr:aldehyde ferredoxin oxidoreductase N-terminal domain-containing protein [Desulfosporosinus nitroreducens]MDO0823012.1 aldehyde dehydrogenase [Desulfosporosinus nitroreducens]